MQDANQSAVTPEQEAQVLLLRLAERHEGLREKCPKDFRWGPCPGAGQQATADKRCPHCGCGVRPTSKNNVRPHSASLPGHDETCRCQGRGYQPLPLLEAVSYLLEKRIVRQLAWLPGMEQWTATGKDFQLIWHPIWWLAVLRVGAQVLGE